METCSAGVEEVGALFSEEFSTSSRIALLIIWFTRAHSALSLVAFVISFDEGAGEGVNWKCIGFPLFPPIEFTKEPIAELIV